MDAMEFFERSAGRWRSQRTTHHLPFRRTETGNSEIVVEALDTADARIIEICKLHGVEPALAIGGAYVNWSGTMAWDQQDDEEHEGSTVFALVPDQDNPKAGQLLRERGYAEIVPVIGRYEMDEADGLVLVTEYETMSSIERFWFADADLRLRTSTVKRFGGFSTASFCTESRLEVGAERDRSQAQSELSPQLKNRVGSEPVYSLLGW